MPDKSILCVVGTRPEVIKMAPVIHALADTPGVRPIVCSTGQHRAILDQMMAFFDLQSDVDLDIMKPGQSLSGIAAAAISGLDAVLVEHKPDWVVVQGDTTTAMIAAMAAFHRGIPVAHVEAGLRTSDRKKPYPEEMNRRLISQIADIHFAPTEKAEQALRAEGHPTDSVINAGNTVIDALMATRQRIRDGELAAPAWLQEKRQGRTLILLTMHRRENFDGGIARVCDALAEFSDAHPEYLIVFPVHPNPTVRQPVSERLEHRPGIHLIDPLNYPDLIAVLDQAQFVVTDSGGIQEEGSALGKPLVVLRDETERPEAVANGNAKLVGTDKARIIALMTELASSEDRRAEMAGACEAFGKGDAGRRIADAIAARSLGD